ncbi:MAG: GTP cyclohydrolase II [Planctomycetaceae bacterium]|nr:GTP cyclohydrolase II [Planctomycetaceae bacterium]
MNTESSVSIERALEQLRRGGIVIVIDPQDRENEGDFICAAETITPEQVNFMLRHGSGMLCVPLATEVAERLQLPTMVEKNTSPNQTPFLIPIDHRDAGTGISTENRAKTIRAMSDPRGRAEDFVRPGHIHPLLAKPGGVLRRAGHTEAVVDLMQLSGRQPVGVLIEILSPTGNGMATLPELEQMSKEFDIPIITIEDLIRYRRLREHLVTRAVEVDMPTRYGNARMIAYDVAHDDQQPLAIVFGDLKSVDAPLIRMHSSCFTGDVLDSLRCDCGDQLHLALQMIGDSGAGAVVYLPQEGRGIGLVAKLKAYKLQDEGYDTVEANHKLGFKADMRDYMVGLQILKDLGLSKIRLLTNNPKKTDAFIYGGFELEVVDQIPIMPQPNEHNAQYLATKRDKMGHQLPPERDE